MAMLLFRAPVSSTRGSYEGALSCNGAASPRSRYRTFEKFITHRAVEGFTAAVLPRAPQADVKRLDAVLGQPFRNCRCEKFRAVVGSDMRWRSTRDEQLGQCFQQIFAAQLLWGSERQPPCSGSCIADDRSAWISVAFQPLSVIPVLNASADQTK